MAVVVNDVDKEWISEQNLWMTKRESGKKAIIIGSGFGGLSLGIRLQSLGFSTTISKSWMAPVAAPMCAKRKALRLTWGQRSSPCRTSSRNYFRLKCGQSQSR